MSASLSPELWPFLLASSLLVAVAAVEALTLLLGASASHWVDALIEHPGEPDGALSATLGWLHVGKVPLLAILVIFATAFAVTGFVVQFAARGVTGHFIAVLPAVVLAALGGVLAVRFLGAQLGRIIPRDESAAVPDASLVGRVAVVVIGAARAGRPAEARTHDEHGAAHYVMIEPEEPSEILSAGASVLLVRHLRGRHYHAIRNPKPGLL